MRSFFLFLCALLTLTPFILTKGRKPSNDFRCRSLENPKTVYIAIETGSQLFVGTVNQIQILLNDSADVSCTANDLNNPGNDHYVVSCPEAFAKANDSLSVLLLHHTRSRKNPPVYRYADEWSIERIAVRTKDVTLFDYRFSARTNPGKTIMSGVSKVTVSELNNGIRTPPYNIILL